MTEVYGEVYNINDGTGDEAKMKSLKSANQGLMTLLKTFQVILKIKLLSHCFYS